MTPLYQLQALAAKQALAGLNRHERRQAAALVHHKGGWGWRVRKQRIGEGRARRRRGAEGQG